MFGLFDNRRYKNQIDRLIRQWTEYRNTVLGRLGTDDLGPEEERRFLELKGKLAEKVAGMAQDMGLAPSQELSAHQRTMADFLNGHTTLHADEPLNDQEREAFEREWHRHYLFLNKLKGMKPAPKAAAPLSPVMPASLAPPPPLAGPMYGPGSWFASLILRLGALAAAVWAAIRFIPWERLDSVNATEVTGDGTGGVMSQSWSSVKGFFAGMNTGGVSNIYQPVVDKYGPELTSVLVGVLLLSLGYWLFIRSR